MLHLIPFTATWTNGFMSGIKGFLSLNSAKWCYQDSGAVRWGNKSEHLPAKTIRIENCCNYKRIWLPRFQLVVEYSALRLPTSSIDWRCGSTVDQISICMVSAPERRSKLLYHKICGIVSENMKHVLSLTSLHLSETLEMTNRHNFRGNFRN